MSKLRLALRTILSRNRYCSISNRFATSWRLVARAVSPVPRKRMRRRVPPWVRGRVRDETEYRVNPVERQICKIRLSNRTRTQRSTRRDAYPLTGFSRTNGYICPILFFHILYTLIPGRSTMIPADTYDSGIRDPISWFITLVTLYHIIYESNKRNCVVVF